MALDVQHMFEENLLWNVVDLAYECFWWIRFQQSFHVDRWMAYGPCPSGDLPCFNHDTDVTKKSTVGLLIFQKPSRSIGSAILKCYKMDHNPTSSRERGTNQMAVPHLLPHHLHSLAVWMKTSIEWYNISILSCHCQGQLQHMSWDILENLWADHECLRFERQMLKSGSQAWSPSVCTQMCTTVRQHHYSKSQKGMHTFI